MGSEGDKEKVVEALFDSCYKEKKSFELCFDEVMHKLIEMEKQNRKTEETEEGGSLLALHAYATTKLIMRSADNFAKFIAKLKEFAEAKDEEKNDKAIEVIAAFFDAFEPLFMATMMVHSLDIIVDALRGFVNSIKSEKDKEAKE